MGVKQLYVWNGSKNILGVKWEYQYYKCQIGPKMF